LSLVYGLMSFPFSGTSRF